MSKKEDDPYKNVELGQKDKFIEYIVTAAAVIMMSFFFLKTLFF